MKLYFDFGLIQILNSVLILEHMPATELKKLDSLLGPDYYRIGAIYERNLNVQAFDTALAIRLHSLSISDQKELNNIIGTKKL